MDKKVITEIQDSNSIPEIPGIALIILSLFLFLCQNSKSKLLKIYAKNQLKSIIK